MVSGTRTLSTLPEIKKKLFSSKSEGYLDRQAPEGPRAQWSKKRCNKFNNNNENEYRM